MKQRGIYFQVVVEVVMRFLSSVVLVYGDWIYLTKFWYFGVEV